MSDAQHPEIVDIGLGPVMQPTHALLIEITGGLLSHVHDALARGMAQRLLELEEDKKHWDEFEDYANQHSDHNGARTLIAYWKSKAQEAERELAAVRAQAAQAAPETRA